MSYYRYQYKQQCYIPGGTKCPTPTFAQQCHPPGAPKCVQCPPCAPAGAKVCSVRKIPQSPGCCSPRCVETHVVEGHSSSSSSSCCCCCSSPGSRNIYTLSFPQPPGQGRGPLCVSQCGQGGVRRCPQVCAPAPLHQHGSHPYSYQWSNSYQYDCGHQ